MSNPQRLSNSSTMFSDYSHVCQLPEKLKNLSVPPTIGCWPRFMLNVRKLMLACKWHHGSKMFIRSRKSLEEERNQHLRSGHWMVVHPYSPLAFYWDCAVFLLTMLVFFYMPYQIFLYCPSRFDALILTSDFVAFLDFLINFVTGYTDQNHRAVVLAPKEIAKHYAKTNLLLDLIGALPLQVIELYPKCDPPTHTIFFAAKLLRLQSLQKKWKHVNEQLELSFPLTAALNMTLGIILFCHWTTWFYYQVPCLISHWYVDDQDIRSWLERHKVGQHVSSDSVEKYFTSLFYVCGLCIGAGYMKPVVEHIIAELILNSIIALAGHMIFLYSIMTLLRLQFYVNHQKYLYAGRAKELEKYMTCKRLPSILRKKIRLFLNYTYEGNYFNEKSIINTVNEQIKQEINVYACGKLVENAPIFRDMPVPLLNNIIFSLVHKLYLPGDMIARHDQLGESLYLISSGTVAVIAPNGNEIVRLKDGAYFGQDSLLHPGAPRNSTYIALEICELYKLHSNAFQRCLQPYPHIKRRLESQIRRQTMTSL